VNEQASSAQGCATLTGKWLTIVGVVIAIVLVAATIFPLSCHRSGEKARRAMCMINEKQIAQAMAMYGDDHNGKCTSRLDDLRKYVTTDNIFHCPSSKISERSYQIFCSTNVNDIIVRENPADHLGRGGNVAYADGHVEWVQTQARAPSN
jgi:prepilin-type processing-associated H-X9-DG protein